ncbi:S1/P1 nuclease-domain-containing protein [Mycena maculata]|uniref:S1/P1 nuclease-domain-containing protein n=1 Tax=Mycena maculata TaxID=230809 RepID=A0AAD7HQZ8_9AGAR|nr:S1/P1 nuclease-domain-containing protein [Mycena maculata]
MTSYLLIGLATLQGVRAWGVLGHATVAYIAQNYVTSETASWAQGVLDDTSDSYLANIASWADDYRETTAGAWSAPFHFIDAEDNPPTDCNVDYTRDCGSTGCSVSALANYTQRVGDGRLSATNINQALMFLVHFVGDITQPLHDEAYEVGANDVDVTFMGYSDNLHADWDTYIPEELIGGATLADAQSWANTLIKDIDSGTYKSVAASWIDGDDVSDVVTTATRWASDANAFVCSVVMPNGAAALTAEKDLYPGYYNDVVPTIELQISKAGYRLANWLNMIYTSEIATKRGLSIRTALTSRMVEESELDGRTFLPEPQPLSKAKLARAAVGYGMLVCFFFVHTDLDHHLAEEDAQLAAYFSAHG